MTRMFWTPQLALVAALAFASLPGAAATNPHVEPNQGTIKIHDNETADPPQRNEPHVTCDFWVEGFNMADATGDLVFYGWPPTGNMSVVMVANFTGAAEEDENGGYHFLEGAFFLPAGHYRIEAVGEDEQVMAKSKTFWVEPCDEPGTPGETPCPTDVSADANEDGSITVTWTVAAGSNGTNLYRAVGDGEFEYVTTFPANTTSYTDGDTEVGSAYTYRLTGLFGVQESTGCEDVAVTAIPVFPSAILAGLALLAACGAYVALRRR